MRGFILIIGYCDSTAKELRKKRHFQGDIKEDVEKKMNKKKLYCIIIFHFRVADVLQLRNQYTLILTSYIMHFESITVQSVYYIFKRARATLLNEISVKKHF